MGEWQKSAFFIYIAEICSFHLLSAIRKSLSHFDLKQDLNACFKLVYVKGLI